VFGLNPFETGTSKCGNKLSNSISQKKLDFICKMDSVVVPWLKYLLLGGVGFSALCCLTTMFFFCKNKKETQS